MVEIVRVRRYPTGQSLALPIDFSKVFENAEFAKVECVDGKVIYSPLE